MHRRWRRRTATAKARHYRRRAINHDFFLSGKNPSFVLEEPISQATLEKFCEGQDFLSLPKLVSKFDDEKGDKLCAKLKKFIAQTDTAGHVKCIKGCMARANLLCGTPSEVRFGSSSSQDPRLTVLIWDTGASYGLTPFRSDFIDYVKCDIPVKDVTKVNRVIGIGTTIHKFVDENGKPVFVPCVSYHLPTTDVRLFSPQTYHQLHGGRSIVEGFNVTMQLRRRNIVIPINRKEANLPIVFNSFVNSAEKKRHGPRMRSCMALTGLASLDFFGDLRTTSELRSVSDDEMLFENEFEHYSKFCGQCADSEITNFCGPCVGSECNQNITAPQKELLLWHWKLGISMYRIQELMREQTMEEPNGTKSILPPIICPRHPSATSCPVPACTSCILARAKKRATGTKKQKAVKEKDGILSRDQYKPGDLVSADQFVVNTPGRLPTGYGREASSSRFHGGTIYNDAATGIIWVENQVSLGANETVMGKARFEEWLWEQACVEISHIHSDNGIFASDEFRLDCGNKKQDQTFSGVGAQHQNARAERAIQTIMYMARTFMVHTSLHWTDHGADDIALWSFAVKHAAWLHNRLPNRVSGLTPLELLTNTKSDHRDLRRCHVWGCPAYVLDPKLQNDQKIPKWNRRSRLGQFLGFSSQHSSLVANIRHLKTGHVSPQYHVVFDDLFSTVFSLGENDAIIDAVCNELFDHNRDWYATEEYEDGKLVYRPPPLHEVWLTEPERRNRRDELSKQRERNEQSMRERNQQLPDQQLPDIIPLTNDDALPPSGPVVSDDEDSLPGAQESEGEVFGPADDHFDDNDGQSIQQPQSPPQPASASPEGAPEGARSRRRSRRPIWERDSNDRLRRLNLNKQIFALTCGHHQQPMNSKRLSKKRQRLKYKQWKRELREGGDAALNRMSIEHDIPTVAELMESPLARFITLAANDCGYGGSTKELIVNWVHPLFLKAKAEASKEDNPNWNQAMNGPFADEYWKAACTEIETLESMGAWDVVKRDDKMNVIKSTWAFKLKRYPDGLIKKFKARFCARGDMQLEGVDFFETYAPVVQWTTVRLMLILEVLLELKSKQGDITAAFLHADLEEDEKVYVEMPKGFEQYDKRGRKKVLKLRKTLYGLRQSPRAFWKYLTQKLNECGVPQTNLDPCLFISDRVICICYVDDLIFWAKDENDIHDLAIKLREKGVDLEQEEDAAGFLGVNLERDEDTGLLEMKQVGLTDRVIEALGLDEGTVNGKFTPSESTPLAKDEDGIPASGTFSYSSVVGMLLYLSGHTRPDIAYAVNCCARYMFCPKHSHEQALKRIGRYLKLTRERGLILNPNSDLCKLDCYPDADFAGMYGHEKHNDPACVKSRTGFVITFADCPVLWMSKLQTVTALSTMEAEINALAHSCRELFPVIDMTKALGKAVGLPVGDTTISVSIHEDNAGALILAQTLPPQFTHRSKHYATKTIWFREEIVKRGIKLLKIDTVEQLGDLFTKGLPRATFEYLRKKLMNW